MARNKYPEQTVARILEVSARLFIEKGYENTSIQDIINELGNLSKGAIYHHFKSKEDIFDAVATSMGESNVHLFSTLSKDKSLNGAQKLQKVIRDNIFSHSTKDIVGMTPNLFDNPKFLAMYMKQIKDGEMTNYLRPIIEEGVRDGSIVTDNPAELSEVIIILVNVWLNPLILGDDPKKIPIQCKIVNELLSSYNIVLFDEETIEKLSQF